MSSESTQGATPSFSKGSPCWIEIMTPDPRKLKEFYAALFPNWKFSGDENPDEDVTHLLFVQPGGLSGGLVKLPEECGVQATQAMGVGFTVYYFTDSIDKMAKEIIKLGGTKVLDKRAEKDNGWYANFHDPEGHRFGLYEINLAKKS